MQFIIKQISPSRKEIRIAINSVNINGVDRYIFGSVNGPFDNGTLHSKYIEPTSGFIEDSISAPTNLALTEYISIYVEELLVANDGHFNYFLEKNDFYSPIINAVFDKFDDTSDNSISTFIIKLLNPLPSGVSKLDTINITKQILSIQEQDVYYIPESPVIPEKISLAYDEGMLEEVGNSDTPNLNYENYNKLTSSFDDTTIIHDILSGSDINLKVNYSNFENHAHFGSAVKKLENFKLKVKTIEDYLVQISQSLSNSGSSGINDFRENLFDNIQKEKSSFTPYEKFLYYKAHKLNSQYKLNLQENYADNFPLVSTRTTELANTDGFKLIYKTSGSTSDSTIGLFTDKYKVENKPFYNWSGSFYLSFLMRGDESIGGSGSINNIVWENRNENYVPKLPHDTLYTSSLLQPSVKSGSWNRYIYHSSMSYFAPASGNPIIGAPGSISDFSLGSSDINILHGNSVTGSYGITVGSRYTYLSTTVTSSGKSFSGSILPAGELFRIYINTGDSANATSSYLTDIKITKVDPTNFLPFGEICRTGSSEFQNWYDDQYVSASLYDEQSLNTLVNNLPEYLRNDNDFDHSTLRQFVDLMGEHFDLIKNYIDNYGSLFSKQYGELDSVPENVMPILGNQYNWQFMIPFGSSGSYGHVDYLGSTTSHLGKNLDVRDNIWRNILNNIVSIYKTKGTHNSIRALLNSYGFPPDILKLREHGASLTSHDSVLTDDTSNLLEGVGGATGNISFIEKKDKLISYIIDKSDRRIKSDWRTNDVTANAVEFILKGVKTANTQLILKSSGSLSESLWDLTLQPFAGDNKKSRLQFRINNSTNGSASIENIANRISMSTDYVDIKNQNFWNVLLQRINATTNDDEGHEQTITYKLYLAEQNGDIIKNFVTASLNVNGGSKAALANANRNFYGTGSRTYNDTGNLVIGETYTGSIAEFRTWKYSLSSSKFKQHVLDKKSTVGNIVLGSRDELIYHYRLNENWQSGSANPKIKDSNPTNIQDYTLNISTNALGHTPLYDEDEYNRIQFSFKGGGSFAMNDNNILINPDARLVDNLNPFQSNILTVFDPLINERKASSVVELVRSPQDVINDFILNQVGDFDFNDKFSNPPDIYEENYKDLDKFAKDFLDYYNISLDINKYIRAQVGIFNKDLIKSLKRLTPARSTFSKIGIELKPTFLERPKKKSHKLQISAPDIKGSIDFHDFEKNIYSFNTTEGVNEASKNANIEIASHTGSIINLTEEYIPPKEGIVEITSAAGTDYYNLTNSKLHQPTIGNLYYEGNTTFSDKYFKSFSDLSDNWGTSSNDTHFIHMAIGAEGKYNDNNTYHYDGRYLFRMIGDVETLSGSYGNNILGKQIDSFHTNYTSSKDFSNQQFIKSDTGLGLRPLGVTHQFKLSTTFSHKGKFLDETFVYPANHNFIVGSSKDGLNNLIYDGTQNVGGIVLSDIFDDLSVDAFYSISTTGENKLKVNRG